MTIFAYTKTVNIMNEFNKDELNVLMIALKSYNDLKYDEMNREECLFMTKLIHKVQLFKEDKIPHTEK